MFRTISWFIRQEFGDVKRVLWKLGKLKALGFTDAYMPHLALDPICNEVSSYCEANKINLIVGAPNPVHVKLPGFESHDGINNMSLCGPGDEWSAIPNFAAPETHEEIERESKLLKGKVSSVFLLCGIDGYFYPDISPVQKSGKEYKRYWCFDKHMRKAFVNYLTERFSNVANYNELYETQFIDFESVTPAKDVSDDRHGVTYTFLSEVMYRFLLRSVTALGRDHKCIDINVPLETMSIEHFFCLGRVGLEGVYESLRPLFEKLNVWQWCNGVYVDNHEKTCPLNLARYSHRWSSKTIVGVEGVEGVLDLGNHLRVLRDGHGGFVCLVKDRFFGVSKKKKLKFSAEMDKVKKLSCMRDKARVVGLVKEALRKVKY